MKAGIRILNETGIGDKVQIIRTDTGEDLTGILDVVKIEIIMELGSITTAKLTCQFQEINIDSDVTHISVHNPVTKQYEKVTMIKFESGDYIDFDGLMRIGK